MFETSLQHQRAMEVEGKLRQEAANCVAQRAGLFQAPGGEQRQVGDWRPSEEVMSLLESLGRQEWLDSEWDK
jgi:hypothetical protein